MTAYMDLNGIPATGNAWLFTEVLRDTWGFEGFVVSDANAVRSLVTHGFAADLTDAAARGVNAGVDMEMAMFDRGVRPPPEAIESGAANAQAVDDGVQPRADREGPDGSVRCPVRRRGTGTEVLADPAHREVARRRRNGPVLLRNDGTSSPRPPHADVDRRDRRARRLERDTLGRRCSTSISTRRSPCWRGFVPGSATGAGGLRAGHRHVEHLYPRHVRPNGRLRESTPPERMGRDAELGRSRRARERRTSPRRRSVNSRTRSARSASRHRSKLQGAAGVASRRSFDRRAGRPRSLMNIDRSTCGGPPSTSRDPRHLVPRRPRRRGDGEPVASGRLRPGGAPLHVAAAPSARCR